jgi:adenylate cyclase, class 2
MRYEVEMKFPMGNAARLTERLQSLGAVVSDARVESDIYFAHPSRDFARTDEALRIRRKGAENFITYKGPKLDAATKTRHEIDLPLPPGASTASAWIDMLSALGFTAVGEVRKARRKTHVSWSGRRVEVSLDEVEGLGRYVELELVVEAEEIEAAKECIASLAAELGLAGGERRSYLELLLAGR